MSLALPSSRRRAPLEIAQVHVVAERRADRLAAAVDEQGDLRLGIVPGAVRAHADVRACSDRREDGRLGEHLGIGTDGDFEILRPQAIVDERGLERGRFRRARHDRADRTADTGLKATANVCRDLVIAARPLFDHAFDGGDREGDAAGLDALQVDGTEELDRRGIEGAKRRTACSSEIAGFDQRCAGRHNARHVDKLAIGDKDGTRLFGGRNATEERPRLPVGQAIWTDPWPIVPAFPEASPVTLTRAIAAFDSATNTRYERLSSAARDRLSLQAEGEWR